MTEPVYLLLVSAFFGAFFYLMERLYRINKKHFTWSVFLPLLSLYLLIKYWDELKNPFICMFFFFLALVAVGIISGQPHGARALILFWHVAIWPIWLGQLLGDFLTPYVERLSKLL